MIGNQPSRLAVPEKASSAPDRQSEFGGRHQPPAPPRHISTENPQSWGMEAIRGSKDIF
jgi:hypothetical protein